jgi:putative membrane protein
MLPPELPEGWVVDYRQTLGCIGRDEQPYTSTVMTTELFLRYIHFISIFAIVGALASEYVLLKKTLTRGELSRLAKVDAVYGIAALTLLVAGLTLWLGGYGKPSEFYSKNWVFHLKLSLFVVVGLLSIYPTVFFLKQRKGNPDEEVSVPETLHWMLRIELLLMLIIPMLAGLMSRGLGYFG